MKNIVSNSLIVVFALLMIPREMGAQNSTVPWSAFNTGSALSTGANTAVGSAVGQELVGSAQAADTRVAGGFLVIIQQQSILGVEEHGLLPADYALHQNYPNPFNPSTTLEFDLPAAADLRIVVYDLLGREVMRLVDRRMEAGYHQLVWNGRDRAGRELPTGMYIVLMMTPEYRKSIKMLLLK